MQSASLVMHSPYRFSNIDKTFDVFFLCFFLQGTGVSQSSWLQQMPFPLHQAVNSPGTPFDSSFPITAPNGFKFAQDSLTGRIFLVPGGDMSKCTQKPVDQLMCIVMAKEFRSQKVCVRGILLLSKLVNDR